MIFKEENILFPASMEKLSNEDWLEILKESDELGYVYIEKPEETKVLMQDLKASLLAEPLFLDGVVTFPTGDLRLKELLGILNTLPFDITFVDNKDRVGYFSDSKDRLFVRSKSIIGREVQNCHPPQSVDVVEKIISDFREGKKNNYDFWLKMKEKFIYIRYFAVRDNKNNYLGTLEVTQEISGIKELEGEKRLLDERD